jgi:hypothetical protein
MTDFYPPIARAIAELGPDAPEEARRAIYDRVRSALAVRLRDAQPPMLESSITREQLSLEEALRKVETGSLNALATIVAPVILLLSLHD